MTGRARSRKRRADARPAARGSAAAQSEGSRTGTACARARSAPAPEGAGVSTLAQGGPVWYAATPAPKRAGNLRPAEPREANRTDRGRLAPTGPAECIKGVAGPSGPAGGHFRERRDRQGFPWHSPAQPRKVRLRRANLPAWCSLRREGHRRPEGGGKIGSAGAGQRSARPARGEASGVV